MSLFVNASTVAEIDTAFVTITQGRAGALLIGPDIFMASQVKQLGALTLRHAMPAIAGTREFVAASGLMSYVSNSRESDRLAGIYTGRILKGEKPGDLPVQQATKVELIINLGTAKAFGLTVPPSLLVRADEVIE